MIQKRICNSQVCMLIIGIRICTLRENVGMWV